MSRRHLVLLLGLSLAFLITRLWALTQYPVFTDEALYIHWALGLERGSGDTLWLALVEGKPLLLLSDELSLASPLSPLAATRSLMVAWGFLGFLTTFWIGRRLYSPKLGLLAATLMLINPLLLFHGRLALADSLLTPLATLVLAASIALAEAPAWDVAVLLALALVGSILAKISGTLTLAFPPLAMLLLGRRGRAVWLAPVLLPAGAVLAWVLPYFFRSEDVQREKSLLAEGAPHLVALWHGNIEQLAKSFWPEVTPLVVLLIGAGLILGLARRDRRTLLLSGVGLLPFVFFALIGRRPDLRYALFGIPPLLIVAATVLDRVRLPVATGLLGAVTVISLHADWLVITDISEARFSETDHWQYTQGWPSGYGFAEAATFLRQAAPATVICNTSRYPQTCESLWISMGPSPGLHAAEADLDRETEWREKPRPLYVVDVAEAPSPPLATLEGAHRALHAPKPGGRTFVDVYLVEP